MESRTVIWLGHVEMHTEYWWRNLKERDRLEDLGVGGKGNNVTMDVNPYPTAFPYGNGMVLHFYQQQESSTTKTVHKVINKGLKAYV